MTNAPERSFIRTSNITFILKNLLFINFGFLILGYNYLNMFFILLVVIIGVLILIFYASRNVVAESVVRFTDQGVEINLIYDKSNKKSLYALALFLLIRTKWIILAEPYWLNEIFTEAFTEVLEKWPDIPFDKSRYSLQNILFKKEEIKEEIFKTRVILTKDYWSLEYRLSRKGYAADLVISYFLLLKEILKHLNNNEKEILKNLLVQIRNDVLQLNDASFSSLHKHEKKINKLLRNL